MQTRRQEWLDALQEVTASFSESVCKGGLRKAPIFFYGWTKARVRVPVRRRTCAPPRHCG